MRDRFGRRILRHCQRPWRVHGKALVVTTRWIELPRQGGPAAPKRLSELPREGGPAAPKRLGGLPREGGPAAPKRLGGLPREGGFSLIETTVAAGLLAASLVSLAQLLDLAVRNNRDARVVTYATLLAEQKLEELRALTWGFDAHGLPNADTSTDTAANPPTSSGGTGLSASPSGSLDVNIGGFVDYVDRFGDKLGGGATAPAGAIYTRRWSIQPLPADPGNGLIIQVVVTRTVAPAGPVSGARRAEARLLAVRTRNSP